MSGQGADAAEPAGKWTVARLGDVAEFFGFHIQTVKQWRSESPPMPGKPGRWDLSEIAQWRLSRDKAIRDDGLRAADIRLKTAQADAKELENARARGNLVEREDVERWAGEALIEARETIMALPEMIAQSSPPEIKNFARSETDRHCRAVLMTLKRRLDEDIPTDGKTD